MAETKLPDLVETLYAILSAGWTSGNTNSRTPIFYKRSRAHTVDHQSDDAVVIYDKALVEKDVTVMRNCFNLEHNASVEVRTPQGRRQAQRMKAEVMRLVQANDSSPTTYVEYNSSSDYTAASFSYDTIEFNGSNIPWDGPDDARIVVEVQARKYYQQEFT